MQTSVVEVSGGLGNQLFQVGAATYLFRNGENVFIDCRPNLSKNSRKNEILELAKSLHLNEFKSKFAILGLDFFEYRLRCKLGFSETLIDEARNFSTPTIGLNVPKKRFRGYWQNKVSASSILDELRDYMRPEYSDEIGMHVRKGDYLLANHNFLHGELPNSYFLEALKSISRDTSTPRVVIYSDSPNLIKTLVAEIEDLRWEVRIETSIDPWETLKKLSGHRILIASNSTFSWWAGFAGCSEQVVFPSAWFSGTEFPPELHFDRCYILKTELLRH